MLTRRVDEALQRIPGFQEQSVKIARSVHEGVLKGGPLRKVADLLHGTWIGHPLHAILTDVTIGAWGLSVFFDALAAIRGDRAARQAADTLVATGIYSAIPTALSGLADFSAIKQPAASAATLHAVLNEINLVLFILSLRERRRGNRSRGVFLSALALALSGASAWLGGHLVYTHNVGTDHSRPLHPTTRWTPALPVADLPEGRPTAADVDGDPVLLYREDRTIYAIGATCSHAGGPLQEGTFEGCRVQCPWHDSVFDLRDGRIIHGPTTHPQPRYDVRVRKGMVECRISKDA